jgi:lipid-A-disaccharide synthase
MPPKIMIVAGEASADLHASTLVNSLRGIDPEIEIYGVGSEKLKQAGARVLYDFSRVSVVGVLEAVPKIKFFLDARDQLTESVAAEKPGLVVLLDLPDFNLSLAKKIKQKFPAQKIVYYISPQVWAWRKGRVNTIKKYIDLMLVILPFEKKFYEDAGVPVKFVGHPLIQVVKPTKPREQLRKELGIAPDEIMLAFLPGSRREELGHYAAPAFTAFKKLQVEFPLKIFLALAPTLKEKLVDGYLEQHPAKVEIVRDRTYDILFASDLGLLGSGTATLETALAELPMVILGRLKKLNYWLVKPFTYVNRVGLPNFIAGRDVVPELIMGECNPERIYEEIKKLITEHDYRKQMKAELAKIREQLGAKDANAEAAAEIMKMLKP